ncbi:MAG: alkaline phosphatase family protein [Flavobacteriaceae bacterium]|nr:alkaline phosphatase family protein [Flavobacteriaceae bacterium]
MKKRPVLSIFADGVRYDSIKYMPFVSSLNSVPLETVLGYSITCHPSMYTGVYPDKHKIAFHWVKGKKEKGPYTFLSYFPDFFPFSNPYVQAVASHFYAKFFLKKKASPFMGYGKLLNLPMKYWNHIDINEFKYWDEDNYINNEIKTIFELVRKNNYSHHISNMHKPNLGRLHSIKTVQPKGYDWVYYFIGESDHVSHEYTQHSDEGIAFLAKLDEFIKEEYSKFEKEYSTDGFDFYFWSDHGHIAIEKRIDLYEFFRNNGVNLKNVFHLVDSTTARFWPKNETQKAKIMEVMKKISEASLVEDYEYELLHLAKDSNLYGELFYYLEGGAVFLYTIHGFGNDVKSMHGYHPDATGNDGLFVSNRHIKYNKATLPDVFVSKIKSLGIDYEPTISLDGRNIVSR